MLISLKGRRVCFDLLGPTDAPVVVLAHSLSSDSGMWADQLPPLLAAGFRVLRVDMRGHGGSEATAGEYRMPGLGEDVADLIEALGLDSIHFVGLSIGGMIGQAVALGRRVRLASLTLCDTLAKTRLGMDVVYGERVSTAIAARSLDPIADATMERWFTPGFKQRRPRRWGEVRETIASTDPVGYAGCVSAILNFDFTDRLATIDVPTLVICGSDDAGTTPEINREIASRIPGARYEEIADARHAPNVEHPKVFNRLLMEWLTA